MGGRRARNRKETISGRDGLGMPGGKASWTSSATKLKRGAGPILWGECYKGGQKGKKVLGPGSKGV